MALPNVNITLGNGNLGRVAANSDSVAGLIVTGAAVAGKLEINKPYVLGSTRDLVTLGIEADTNPLADKEIRAFYTAAGEGSELHLVVVSEATTLTAMCATDAASPLCRLIEAAAGRIRIVGVNKIAPKEYTADVTDGIDADAITATAAAQATIRNFAKQIKPFRLLIAAPGWSGELEGLHKPAEGSSNGVAMVLASDDKGVSAAVGQVLGRAAAIEPHQSIGRVRHGAIAVKGWLTDGSTVEEKAATADALHDAGYIFYRTYPTRNGVYLNSDPMCAPVTDDYSTLANGRVIDKAVTIVYATYIDQIQDNVAVDADGKLPVGQCKNFEAMIENAVATAMDGQISDFKATIDPAQNILSSETLAISCSIVPLGRMTNINVNLEFSNPANKAQQ